MSQKQSRKLLETLRHGDAEYTQTEKALRKELRANGVTLAQLGTSENELKALRRFGQLKLDQLKRDEIKGLEEKVDFIRNQPVCHISVSAVESLIADLKEKDLVAEDIGCTQAELAALTKLAAMTETVAQLGALRRWRHIENWSFPLRAADNLPDMFLKYGLTADDVGSSDSEISLLTREVYKADALRNLAHLAKKHVNFETCREQMMMSLEKAGYTLEDINVRGTHIEDLRAAHHLANCRDALGQVRQFKSEPYVKALNDKLLTAKLTLADVDSSDEEIKGLLRSGHQKEATRLLSCCRAGQSSADPSWVSEQVREHMEKGQLSAQDIDSTDEELAALGLIQVA